MVFFTCNACGASLKKNQVEKHYQNECRNCNVLSCMDCGKDFYGDEYVEHTKCISEAEKYQGALFKEVSGGVSKGDQKQQEWLQRVKQSTTTVKVSARISSLLERISEYPNVPRKKKKFENFVRNSINVHDEGTLSQLWSVFSEASKPPPSNKDDDDVTTTDLTIETPPTTDSEPVKVKKKKPKQSTVDVEEANTVEQDVIVKKKKKASESEAVVVSKKKKNKVKKRKHSSDNTHIQTKKLKIDC